MSDEEILKLSYRRPSRFGELFDRHHKRFLRIAKKSLRSEDDAEDVVQEVFVRIYKYGEKFSLGGGKFVPWANTILKNCIADQIKKYQNAPAGLTEEMQNSSPELMEQSVSFEKMTSASHSERDYVQIALKKIGGAAAEIINLRSVLGKSFKEIGRVLNIKSGTARVRFYRSKKIFAQAYEQIIKNYE